MQVTWENWAVGNYYGAAFGTKPSGGYLWANIRGNNFPEGGGDSASWYTNHGTGESKPLSCPPADVIAG